MIRYRLVVLKMYMFIKVNIEDERLRECTVVNSEHFDNTYRSSFCSGVNWSEKFNEVSTFSYIRQINILYNNFNQFLEFC